MFRYDFVRHAYFAGTAVGAASGLVGYFLLVRRQLFAADALSHVAIAGALASLAFGGDARLGLFAAVVVVAAGLGAAGDHGDTDDVVIGGVFAWVLGLGVLFLSIFASRHATTDSAAGVNVLFGSIYGLNARETVVAVAVAAAVAASVLAAARPLLFVSLDPEVAAARGLSSRVLGVAFLVAVGVTVGEGSQTVGALLVLGLLAAPAAAAQRLTDRPYIALGLSALVAVLGVWIGLALSYAVDSLPPSFAIIATVTAIYAGSLAYSLVQNGDRDDIDGSSGRSPARA